MIYISQTLLTFEASTMKLQRETYMVFILASLCKFYHCYTYEAPYFKGDGIRPNARLFSTSNILPNKTIKQGSSDFLVNTPGCYIPDYTKSYKYAYKLYKGSNNIKDSCGLRAIFLYNIGNNRVTFGVNETAMKFYSKNVKYSCCYMYAYKTATFPGIGTFTKLHFTKCIPFRNGTTVTLQYEIIQVSCITQKNDEIYNDAIISVRKLSFDKAPLKAGLNRSGWNVLLLGIHAMSRARLFGTMPETYQYLSNHNWLDFRGYTKIDASPFSNIMAVLTGMNSSKMHEKCETGLYKCEGDFIWNQFNESGYVTGYGEDFLELPDSFARYKGFFSKPTDHYMRPFYLIGERHESDVLCTKKTPSAKHLLRYVYNFASAYRNKKYFGFFWINSFTYGLTDNPSKFDNEIASWLQKLQRENILKKTFVIFFSDQGIRYGEMKLPVESYYDDRLPMLFVSVPYTFQTKYKQMYTNLILNQHRLATPYDLYVTLGDILKLSESSIKGTVSEACPECTGLFKLNSLFRTCADARINQHCCVCHEMSAVANEAPETNNSLQVAIEYMNKVIKTIKTITCYDCRPLTIRSVIRSHAFESGGRIFHVIAFQTSHDNKFEATITYQRDTSKVSSLRSLTGNSKKGRCVQNITDRPFCHCIMRCNTLIL